MTAGVAVPFAIRPARPDDAEGIWAALEPVIRGGEHYALPRDMSREAALAYWYAPGHDVFVVCQVPSGPLAAARLAIASRSGTDDPFGEWPEGFVAAAPGPDDTGTGTVLGSYFVQANQQGGGAHVANAAYLTAGGVRGRGIARAMCAHSLEHARSRGFRAMQFNFVISTNERAVHLWQVMGFSIIGRIPGGFTHPSLGDVDVLIMFRSL